MSQGSGAPESRHPRVCAKVPNTVGRHELGEDWIPAYAGMTECKGLDKRKETFPAPLPPGEGQGEGKKLSTQSLNGSKKTPPHRTVHTAPRLWRQHLRDVIR